MLGLAIALALQEQGLGTYGTDIFWNKSPVLGTGSVSNKDGIWVNSLPQNIVGDLYTDAVTISTRFADPLDQGIYMVNLLALINNSEWKNTCTLTTKPICSIEFTNVDIGKATSVSLEAVDNEGLWVQAVRFSVRYKLPVKLPLPKSLSEDTSNK